MCINTSIHINTHTHTQLSWVQDYTAITCVSLCDLAWRLPQPRSARVAAAWRAYNLSPDPSKEMSAHPTRHILTSIVTSI